MLSPRGGGREDEDGSVRKRQPIRQPGEGYGRGAGPSPEVARRCVARLGGYGVARGGGGGIVGQGAGWGGGGSGAEAAGSPGAARNPGEAPRNGETSASCGPIPHGAGVSPSAGRALFTERQATSRVAVTRRYGSSGTGSPIRRGMQTPARQTCSSGQARLHWPQWWRLFCRFTHWRSGGHMVCPLGHSPGATARHATARWRRRAGTRRSCWGRCAGSRTRSRTGLVGGAGRLRRCRCGRPDPSRSWCRRRRGPQCHCVAAVHVRQAGRRSVRRSSARPTQDPDWHSHVVAAHRARALVRALPALADAAVAAARCRWAGSGTLQCVAAVHARQAPAQAPAQQRPPTQAFDWQSLPADAGLAQPLLGRRGAAVHRAHLTRWGRARCIAWQAPGGVAGEAGQAVVPLQVAARQVRARPLAQAAAVAVAAVVAGVVAAGAGGIGAAAPAPARRCPATPRRCTPGRCRCRRWRSSGPGRRCRGRRSRRRGCTARPPAACRTTVRCRRCATRTASRCRTG